MNDKKRSADFCEMDAAEVRSSSGGYPDFLPRGISWDVPSFLAQNFLIFEKLFQFIPLSHNLRQQKTRQIRRERERPRQYGSRWRTTRYHRTRMIFALRTPHDAWSFCLYQKTVSRACSKLLSVLLRYIWASRRAVFTTVTNTLSEW